MARKFSELVAKMPPEMRERAADGTAEMLLAISLRKLRKQCRKTQKAIAEALGTSQANVSQIEYRAEIQLSTLRRYVAACGGSLEITARLPDQEVRLLEFKPREWPEPVPAPAQS